MTLEEREALSFAYNVIGYLYPVHFDRREGLKVTGALEVRGLSVPVEIEFYSGWRRQPPELRCYESWLRRHIDWHCYNSGKICWVHAHEWRVFFDYKEHWVKHAALYVLRNAHFLLEKHIIAETLNIPKWLPEWNAYLHGNLAEPQLKEWEDEFRKSKSVA